MLALAEQVSPGLKDSFEKAKQLGGGASTAIPVCCSARVRSAEQKKMVREQTEMLPVRERRIVDPKLGVSQMSQALLDRKHNFGFRPATPSTLAPFGGGLDLVKNETSHEIDAGLVLLPNTARFIEAKK